MVVVKEDLFMFWRAQKLYISMYKGIRTEEAEMTYSQNILEKNFIQTTPLTAQFPLGFYRIGIPVTSFADMSSSEGYFGCHSVQLAGNVAQF